MPLGRKFFAFVVCSGWPALARPVIADQGVTNAASYSMLGAPGAGVAPGSMIVIFGARLGPDTLQQAGAYPLQAELAGTSVRIGEASAFMLYTSATQVAAIVPSTVPPGMHALTVTFNNRTSQPVPVPVSVADLGIFTRNSAGYGQAAAQIVMASTGASQTLGLTSSIRPGEPVVLYGTGLGAIPGALDNQPPGVRRTTAAVEVVIGGRVVAPGYAGRSPNFAGLDQINFIAPLDLAADCYVPLGVRVNGRLSNVVSVPVSRTGSLCPHSFNLGEAALRRIDSGSTAVIALALMERQSSPSGGGEGAGIGFAEVDGNSLEVSASSPRDPHQRSEPGTCAIIMNDLNRTIGVSPEVSSPRFLDAGNTLLFTGPSFSTQLARVPGSTYGTRLEQGVLRSGVWTYSGTGGSDIGRFQLAAELPDALTWTNRQERVDRSQPLRIDWAPGGSDLVRIIVTAGLQGPGQPRFGSIECAAHPQDRTLTVPAALMSALPSGGSGGIILTQSVTKTGFNVPLTRGGPVDGSLFRSVYQTSGQIQVQ
jgi:uncharacterized protein (TIGR03437 family)